MDLPAVEETIKASLEEGLSFKEIAVKVSDELPIKAEVDTLEEAVNVVLADRGAFVIQAIGEGMSGNGVYEIHDDTKRVAIVKVYSAPSQGFVEDVWAQQAALNLELKHFKVPQIYALAKVTIAGEDKLLFIQEAMPGEMLWSDLWSVVHERDPLRKKQLLRKVVVALHKLGKALREFHESSFSKVAPLSKPLSRYLDLMAKGGIKVLREHPEFGVSHEQVEARFLKVRKKATAKRYKWCYAHGDAHFGNFLYSPSERCYALIDLGCGAKFIDSSGLGTGTAWLDYVKLREQILGQAVDADPKDVQILTKAFAAGYGNFSSSSIEYQYFFICNSLSSIHWFYRVKESLSAKDREGVEKALKARFQRIVKASSEI